MNAGHDHGSTTTVRTPPAITRRSLLVGGGLLGAGLALTDWTAPVALAESAGTVLPLVAPLPSGTPARSAFSGSEQVFGEFVTIVAPLANSVVDDDPQLYGWMEDGWWRSPNDPMNARIMEHVATLSWFLSHQRTWNPYYLDSALQGRLDAAIGYYLSLQGPTGAWPAVTQSESLATTGFGVSALLETLRNLRLVNRLPARQTQIETATFAGAQWLNDTSRSHWSTPLQYANQVVGAVAAVAEAADTLPSATLAATLGDRIDRLADHAQAPAGYFHEPLCLDQRYSLITQMPDLALLHRYTGNPQIVTMVEKFFDFTSLSLIYEPGVVGGGSYYFASACARTASRARPDPRSERGDNAGITRDFLTDVPVVGAFFISSQDKQAARTEWATDPNPVPARAKGDTEPRHWMHTPLAPDNVSQTQRDALLQDLPYFKRSTFTELRSGTIDQDLLFVRRPGFYFGGVAGDRGELNGRPAMVRVGNGFLWHPDAGMIIHSINDTADGHWTTLGQDGRDPALHRRAAGYHAGSGSSGTAIAPQDLAGHTGVFTQQLTSTSTGITSRTAFLADGVTTTVTSPIAAAELIPLVLRTGDTLTFSDGTSATRGQTVAVTATRVVLRRGAVTVTIDWSTAAPVQLAPTGRTYLLNNHSEQHRLRISHPGTLTTHISFA